MTNMTNNKRQNSAAFLYFWGTFFIMVSVGCWAKMNRYQVIEGTRLIMLDRWTGESWEGRSTMPGSLDDRSSRLDFQRTE